MKSLWQVTGRRKWRPGRDGKEWHRAFGSGVFISGERSADPAGELAAPQTPREYLNPDEGNFR